MASETIRERANELSGNYQWLRVVELWDAGNLIPADEADARVAAAERKGMEMALKIAEDYENACNCDGACASSIRADMEADDG